MPVSLHGLLELRNRLAYNPKAVHDAVQDLEAHLSAISLICSSSSLEVSVIL
jgi:hypothetical protein